MKRARPLGAPDAPPARTSAAWVSGGYFREIVRDVGRLRASMGVRYNKGVEPGDLPGDKP
ncbi:MAG TPA: hypothetical protein VKP69_03930 [Isosphaeraceae bacterium]|nr:hypothetical protein [Isosphaeraceae bacterium]